jgi:hypothetical protein
MVIMSREDSVNLLILPLVVRSRRIRRGTRGKRKIECHGYNEQRGFSEPSNSPLSSKIKKNQKGNKRKKKN